MWSFLRGCVRLRDSQIIPVVVHALVHKWAVQQLITVLYWCFHSLYLCHKASTGLGSAGSNTAYKPLDSISCWKKHFWNCLICPKPKHSADYYNLTCHPSIILAALHLHARILHLHSCFQLHCCSLEAEFHFYLCCCCCRRTSILICCCGEKCVKAFLRVCVCVWDFGGCQKIPAAAPGVLQYYLVMLSFTSHGLYRSGSAGKAGRLSLMQLINTGLDQILGKIVVDCTHSADYYKQTYHPSIYYLTRLVIKGRLCWSPYTRDTLMLTPRNNFWSPDDVNTEFSRLWEETLKAQLKLKWGDNTIHRCPLTCHAMLLQISLNLHWLL